MEYKKWRTYPANLPGGAQAINVGSSYALMVVPSHSHYSLFGPIFLAPSSECTISGLSARLCKGFLFLRNPFCLKSQGY